MLHDATRASLACCRSPRPAVVWGKACGLQVEPNPGEMAQRYGAEMSVLDWQRLPTMTRVLRRQSSVSFCRMSVRR